MLTKQTILNAKEINRRRKKALGNVAPPYRRTLMEMYLLERYAHREYTFDDVRQDEQRGMVFCPKDPQGLVIEVVGHHYEDKLYRVYEPQLDNDVIVFWDYNKEDDEDFVLGGYLPVEMIEECPIGWVDNEKGEHVSFYHEVHPCFLWPMPEDFTFSREMRPHTCQNALVWSYEARAWRCLQCKVGFPSQSERDLIEDGPKSTT